MAWPIGKKAHNNIVDNILDEDLEKIKDLRLKKKLSYAKIDKEMNYGCGRSFKIIKKYLGLRTHRK